MAKEDCGRSWLSWRARQHKPGTRLEKEKFHAAVTVMSTTILVEVGIDAGVSADADVDTSSSTEIIQWQRAKIAALEAKIALLEAKQR